MNTKDIINKKEKNKILTYEELSFFFNGYINDNISDEKMALLLKAICKKGMSNEEIINLTDIFINSGETLDFKKFRGTIDKHSTGGTGDKTTLILLPILAECGLKIPKMSGRGLGYTGGTIDKLESIGVKVNLTEKEFYNGVENIGFAITGQTKNLCPMDKKVYALRDVTNTTESIGLIASSIMSKKIASGADKILIDLKIGKGALIKNVKDARKLATIMIKIGKKYNKEVKCMLTRMDNPLGNNIGNLIEIIEVIDFLQDKVRNNLYDLVIPMAVEMVCMMKDIPKLYARREVIDAISCGGAYERFVEFVKYQKGKLSISLPEGKSIFSTKSGYIKKIDALALGKVSMTLGAGRIKKDESIDYDAGIILNKNVGDHVKKGELLCTLYGKNINTKDIEKSFVYSKVKTKREKIIVDIIG